MVEAQTHQNQDEGGLPLADVALDMIRMGDGAERYTLHPRGPDVIKGGVQAILLSGEPESRMADRFREVINLCHVLREEKRCPQAADELGEALLADERVLQILRRSSSAADLRATKSKKLLSNGPDARAPKVDDKSPEDSVKLHSFLNPGQQQRPARKTAKTEPMTLTPPPRQGPSSGPPQPRPHVAPPPHGRKA